MNELGWWPWVAINSEHWLAPALLLSTVLLLVYPARKRWLLPIAGLLFLLDMTALLSPHIALFARMQWNWQGKLLESAWPLAIGSTGALYSWRAIGLRPPARGTWPAILIAAVLALVLSLPIDFGPMHMPVDRETVFFELTLPGLAEELVYRGVLLWACNEVFGRPWNLGGARVGWGFVVTTLLFATGHLVFVDHQLHAHFSGISFAFAGVTGALLCWVRERSGSVWPCVALHNLINGMTLFPGLLG